MVIFGGVESNSNFGIFLKPTVLGQNLTETLQKLNQQLLLASGLLLNSLLWGSLLWWGRPLRGKSVTEQEL